MFSKLVLFSGALLLHSAVFAQEEVTIVGPAVARCDPNLDPAVTLCTADYTPVCAFRDNDPPGSLGSTESNECNACVQGYDYFVYGACEESGEGEVGEGEGEAGEGEGEFGEGEGEFGEGEFSEGTIDGAKWCQPSNLAATDVICTLQYEPVCAYNIGDESGATIGNACQACNQKGYDYYTDGECARDEEFIEEPPEETEGPVEEPAEEIEEPVEEVIIPVDPIEQQPAEEPAVEIECDPIVGKARDHVCSTIYEPVCAYRRRGAQGTTQSNFCVACVAGYSYYFEGECSS